MSSTKARPVSLERKDHFISVLKSMQADYPKYEQVLELLIEQMKEGKLLSIQEKLRQLDDESW